MNKSRFIIINGITALSAILITSIPNWGRDLTAVLLPVWILIPFFSLMFFMSSKTELQNLRKYYSDSHLYYLIEINPTSIRMKPPLVPIPEDFF